MQPIPRQHLHNTHPRQDTRRQRIKRSNRNDSTRIIPIELLKYADTNGHADWGDEHENTTHDALLQRRDCDAREACNTGAEGNAFEHLVEENDDEECDEGTVTGNDKGDTNHCFVVLDEQKASRLMMRLTNRVEDNAGLEVDHIDLFLHGGSLAHGSVAMNIGGMGLN